MRQLSIQVTMYKKLKIMGQRMAFNTEAFAHTIHQAMKSTKITKSKRIQG